ncbi:MAG TPA: glycosyl hydrolase family 28-related protein [Polyangia bacterium]|nr:glycosyl hydrolase family 28-related protein [Polyangia bacterium]
MRPCWHLRQGRAALLTAAIAAAGCGAEQADLTGVMISDGAAASDIVTGIDQAPAPDDSGPPGPIVTPDAGGGTVDTAISMPPPDGGTAPSDVPPQDSVTTPDRPGGILLPWPAAVAIVGAVKPPTFPNKTCALGDYGGNGDGVTDNTAAFAAAIAACSKAGGGHVTVPAGTFVTGAIALLDDIDLHIDAGTTLAFSGDETKYPLVLTRYQGIELMNRSPLIYAFGRKNIAVTGAGVLDAAQTVSWNVTDDSAWTTLMGWGADGTPVKQRVLPAGSRLRTSVVMPYQSQNVLIAGVSVKNSPFWQIHPTLSTNVTLQDVTTASSGTEATGLVIESSNDVVLQNGSFVAGSDCVALKSGRDNDGRRVNVPTKNVVLIHVRCQGAGGLLAVGSEETGGVQNIYASDLATMGTGIDTVLFMKATPTRGGVVSDLFLDAINASSLRGTFFVATLTWTGLTTGDFPATFGPVSISHVTVDGAARVLDVEGLAVSLLGPFNISEATFTKIGQATSTVRFTKAVTYAGVTVNGVAVN